MKLLPGNKRITKGWIPCEHCVIDPRRSTLDARRWGVDEAAERTPVKFVGSYFAPGSRRVRSAQVYFGRFHAPECWVYFLLSFPQLWLKTFISMFNPGHYFDGWMLKDECVSGCHTPRIYELTEIINTYLRLENEKITVLVKVWISLYIKYTRQWWSLNSVWFSDYCLHARVRTPDESTKSI